MVCVEILVNVCGKGVSLNTQLIQEKEPSMPITHKIFLYWLLYLALIGFTAVILTLLGLPQLAFAHDKSYLSVGLLIMYAAAEILAGKQAIWVSRQHRNLTEACAWLRSNQLRSLIRITDGSIMMGSGKDSFTVLPGPFADLLSSMIEQSKNGTKNLDNRVLLDAMIEHLERRTSVGEFIAARIVWVGILATIVGVIMAFWPFQQAGMSIDSMRSNLGGFFSGVAVAFIPTAVSFIFKITLDFNSKILQDGISEIIEMAAYASSSQVMPRLDDGSIRS